MGLISVVLIALARDTVSSRDPAVHKTTDDVTNVFWYMASFMSLAVGSFAAIVVAFCNMDSAWNAAGDREETIDRSRTTRPTQRTGSVDPNFTRTLLRVPVEQASAAIRLMNAIRQAPRVEQASDVAVRLMNAIG